MINSKERRSQKRSGRKHLKRAIKLAKWTPDLVRAPGEILTCIVKVPRDGIKDGERDVLLVSESIPIPLYGKIDSDSQSIGNCKRHILYRVHNCREGGGSKEIGQLKSRQASHTKQACCREFLASQSSPAKAVPKKPAAAGKQSLLGRKESCPILQRNDDTASSCFDCRGISCLRAVRGSTRQKESSCSAYYPALAEALLWLFNHN